MMPQNEVAYLCPGEQYSTVCSTNQTCLEWVIRHPSYDNNHSYHQDINVSSSVGNYLWRHIEDTAINYTKDSEPGVLPLTSTLIINFITSSLNGTIIECCSHEEVPNNVYCCGEGISTTLIQVINGKLKLIQV